MIIYINILVHRVYSTEEELEKALRIVRQQNKINTDKNGNIHILKYS